MMPIRVLLQTTLPPTAIDDWVIARFSLLNEYLSSLSDEEGNSLVEVTARDRRVDAEGNDAVLSQLDRQPFDQLWLFALDVGDGLSAADCAGITRFHQQGGGILTTRDHQDMGISMCALPTLGAFHYFRTRQVDPNPDRCCRDDNETLTIDWPNYHSGRNGDYQEIIPVQLLHPLLKNPESPDGMIHLFPAHPHEGGVGVPEQDIAEVVAMGRSKVTGREFNLVVASDRTLDATTGTRLGRTVAQSTFHHFVDYNWDISKGCPTFVEEPPGTGMTDHPQAMSDIYAYVKNLVLWLGTDD